MPDHAKTSGYTLEAVAKMLKAFDSYPVKGNWRKHRKIEELEYYQCEITWLSKSHAVELAGDVISPLTFRSVVPRGMQGLFRKLQSFNGRSVQSLPPSVKEHFLVENTNRLKELELDIKCSFSGRPFLDFQEKKV